MITAHAVLTFIDWELAAWLLGIGAVSLCLDGGLDRLRHARAMRAFRHAHGLDVDDGSK